MQTNSPIDVNQLPLEGSVRRTVWEDLSDEDMLKYARRFAEYYQAMGFPYPTMTEEERKKDVARNKELGAANINEETGEVQQKMNGLSFCWHYHPHAFETPAGADKSRTPMDVFNDIELLTSTIYKRMQSKHSGNMSVNMLRKALRAYNGVQAVSNFRPTAAWSLYDRFAKMMDKEDISTWDMSGGYGGRLLGAVLSGIVRTYIATEPATDTFEGLSQMASDLEDWGFVERDSGADMGIGLVQKGSETWHPRKSVDLVMTSPPYFNTERYSDEDTQSYVKFPEYEEWIEGFFRQSIKNAKACLKPEGLLVINIADVRTAKTLEDDALRIMQEEGFELIETLKLKLSGRPNKKGELFRYEPIFVMRQIAS